ncbi:MAG: type II toxin-antitoxin system Phd/YefM family antitoxin [Tissierellia bacterium]|nr:type II toxin-antitoxin system Phd/YefM family antitoxin [Tissierellia bacterium]MDD4779252.1 type II toxin-antitoxin system Phd/YefM family antitoxin [Tissierellia bacterium]
MFVVDYENAIINLDEIIDKVTDENEAAVITAKNNKNVVLMSLDEYNKLMKNIFVNKNS